MDIKTNHSAVGEFSNYITAKEMAFLSHNLSSDGDTARRSDGSVWKWSDHFGVWLCFEESLDLCHRCS